MAHPFITTRRDFLTTGLGVVGVGAALPAFLVRTALAGPSAKPGESILVVLQLSGGHDGLSAVVPYRNDDYARARTATRIAEKDVLKVNDEVGLHPNLKGFRDLLDQGSFAVVQGVGYPNPNRSHFKAMDIWHTADNSGRPVGAGWLGRYADQAAGDPKRVVAVGTEKAPLAVQGKSVVGLTLQRPEAFRYLPGRTSPRLEQAHRKLGRTPAREEPSNPNLQFVTRTAAAATAAGDEIARLAQRQRSSPGYPTTPLANSLKTVASLIAGGLSTRVYYVFHGGYDTHAGQRQRHDRLMAELGDAVVAFQKDLTEQGNAGRVLTLAFSEFGRRVRENGGQGTDHGTAGPMFLVGPGVKPGIHGQHPSLAPADLDQGDLRLHTDFRGVYATALETWLGTPSEPILGRKFPPLACLKTA
jgi:uncharacterized protein (DUF1501 family)